MEKNDPERYFDSEYEIKVISASFEVIFVALF